MLDPVHELKVRAELLQHALEVGEAAAIELLRVLPEFRKADAETRKAAAATMQRKHCLAVIARELGFTSFDHAQRVLEGDTSEADVGNLLYMTPRGILNSWFADYDEARDALAQTSTVSERRYLLAYKRHFFVAERPFIVALGLDPDDADWAAIGWDWARPHNPDARRRLYGKLLGAQRPPKHGTN
ncbi:MAG TPA: hypothetical protein VHV30_07055 [Polyangiaceae bacterium]|jgi:hypothetical protein|nr:hypothetical protein [Polyangiaceae bacterium]